MRKLGLDLAPPWGKASQLLTWNQTSVRPVPEYYSTHITTMQGKKENLLEKFSFLYDNVNIHTINTEQFQIEKGFYYGQTNNATSVQLL